MSLYSLRGSLLPPLLVFLVVCSAFDASDAMRGYQWRARRQLKLKPKPSPSLNLGSGLSPQTVVEFSVVDYGAKGNGVTDDTKAFLAAWTAACKVEASTVVVPSKLKFLVSPISFIGPCQPNIVFQLDGTIIAPTSPGPWGSGLLQWLEFKKLIGGISVQGKGIIEGQGSAWWTTTNYTMLNNNNNNQENGFGLKGNMPHTRPTALRFYGSTNVSVSGITIQNSPQCHLKFDSCKVVQVFNMSISSPANIPNTDGIHLQNSADVSIHDTDLSCGDDCISIQTGCSNVHVHHVNCGPGHGISIGGLGMDKTAAHVSNITAQYVNMYNTLTAVRIKTWQGGSGSVQNIKFSNIQVSNVQTPIDIDQFYCGGSGRCKNQSSAIALSQISYENIRGTYTHQPVYLACSDNSPCIDISFADIDLQPLQNTSHTDNSFCWKAYGVLHSSIVPPIDCLQSEK